MSLITIGVGQCGCQLAGEFIASSFKHLNSLHNTASPKESCFSSVLVDSIYKFSTPTEKDHHILEPQALLVDAEPRVAEGTIKTLQSCFTSPSDLRLQWPAKYGSVISSSKTGSGNNYASGAFQVWPLVADKTIKSLRKAIEKCDHCRGCSLFMSLGGGTGSGVGSTLARHFHEAFPDIDLLTLGVLPHSSGEASTQTYNCLLSLSTLAEYSDACILLPNDSIAAHCAPVVASMSASAAKKHHHSTTSFATMNAFIADQVMSLLMPAHGVASVSDATAPALAQPRNYLTSFNDDMYIDSLIQKVASHPDYRFLLLDKVPTIRPTPVLSFDPADSKSQQDLNAYSLVAEATWKSLFRSLSVHSRARECPIDVAPRLPSPIFVLRSAGATPSHRTSSLSSENSSSDSVPSDSLAPWSSQLQGGYQSPFLHGLTPPPHGIHRSVTMLGPSHRVSDLLSPILTRTKSLLPKRAFVHLYEKDGVDADQFEHSLCILERLNHGYSSHF